MINMLGSKDNLKDWFFSFMIWFPVTYIVRLGGKHWETSCGTKDPKFLGRVLSGNWRTDFQVL